MAAPIFSLRGCHYSIGSKPLFRDLTLHLAPGDRLCLLGRNGTGKSTLMKVMAGQLSCDAGDLFRKPGLSAGYLPQEPDLSAYDTLAAYVAAGLTADKDDETWRADVLLEALELRGETHPSAASGGERRRAALAHTLIGEPDLLLLDEPTNHLDLKTILWLEDWLASYTGALVLISHDRAFLRTLSRGAFWLDRGQVRRYDGPFDGFDDWQETQLELERQETHKLERLIKEEARWAVEGISARRRRNQGRLRRLADLRAERRSQIAEVGRATMSVEAGSKSGSRVMECEAIGKSYDGRTLFSDFSLRIMRGDRVGILGPSGAGKTTLVRILMGQEQPDTGTVKLGTNLSPLVIDQNRSDLTPDMTVKDVLTGGRGDYVHRAGGESVHVMTYMKEFLFAQEAANTPVSALSGGERGRLLLARGFAQPSNLLVLDEPTNDLDMDTLDLLVDVLADYDGTLLLVSHDRDFMDRVVTSTVMISDGRAQEYAGGYTDALMQAEASGHNALGALGHHVAVAASTKQAAAKAVDPAVVSNVVSLAQPAPKALKGKGKLSYKDQRALDTLPAEIEALQTDIQLLEANLADPSLYERDAAQFAKLSNKLTHKQQALDEKEMQWLELEDLKERLEKGLD